jgi:two-component system response regulator YesN
VSYTVALVEDEEITREELAKTTPWKELGLELAGCAEDGIAGEKLIRLLEPDIVITDIRMPGQDGLAMLSRCPVSHAIILSGYTDFSYTRKAIHLSVFDYLRKPVDDGELRATLEALVQKIKEEDQDLVRLQGYHSSADRTQNGEEEFITLPGNTGHYLIDGCIRFITENYQDPMGLQEAATSMGVSESHLSRLFKELTGLNFMQYLNAWRINQAIRLIRDPRNNISETASLCGFPTPGYFAKIFRRYTGLTPSQYREGKS